MNKLDIFLYVICVLLITSMPCYLGFMYVNGGDLLMGCTVILTSIVMFGFSIAQIWQGE